MFVRIIKAKPRQFFASFEIFMAMGTIICLDAGDFCDNDNDDGTDYYLTPLRVHTK